MTFPKCAMLAFAALAAGCDDSRPAPDAQALPAAPNAQAASSRRGPQAPDFTLEDIQGKSWTLSSLRGKPIVLSFWFLG